MKIRLVGAEIFHTDRRTDRHDKANSRFSQFCERTKNLPKSMATRLSSRQGYAGQSGLRLPAAAIDFTLFQNVQTSSGIHPASHSMDAGSKADGLTVNHHFHLVQG